MTAPTEAIAYDVMAQNAIVAEALWPDPKTGNFFPNPGPTGQVADQLESALDSSATQVRMDDLTQRYKGKNVWVLDRAKIRDRVKQVVDRVLAQSLTREDNSEQTRERVSEALEKMFENNQNISTQASGSTVALEAQISRLTGVVTQLESAMASMNMQIRRLSGAGGGSMRPRHGMVQRRGERDSANDEVLLEIFKTNLELVREAPASSAGKPALPAGAKSPASGASPGSTSTANPPPSPGAGS